MFFVVSFGFVYVVFFFFVFVRYFDVVNEMERN